MGAEWITHKGKRILYIKYSGLSYEMQLELIREATRILVETNVRDNLTLSDVSDTFVNEEFMALAKEKGKISGPITKKAAIVGVTGVKKVLLKAHNMVSPNPRTPFATIEEAKDWLVE